MEGLELFYLASKNLTLAALSDVYRVEFTKPVSPSPYIFERFTHLLNERNADFIGFSRDYDLNQELFCRLAELQGEDYSFRLILGSCFHTLLVEVFLEPEFSYWRDVIRLRTMPYSLFIEWSARCSLHILQRRKGRLYALVGLDLQEFWRNGEGEQPCFLAVGEERLCLSSLNKLPTATVLVLRRSERLCFCQVSGGSAGDDLAQLMIENGWRSNSWKAWSLSRILFMSDLKSEKELNRT